MFRRLSGCARVGRKVMAAGAPVLGSRMSDRNQQLGSVDFTNPSGTLERR